MILVSGSLAYDQIMDFPGKFSDNIMPDKIHILNVSFLVDTMRKGFGGTAGNIAYNLSLLGIKCAILGIAGGDFSPYKKFLEKKEVETKYIKIINNHNTSAAFGITDKSNNQIWGFYTGADQMSQHLSTTHINDKIDFAVVAPHNPAAMTKFAREYQQKNIPYMFDPGMQLPWFSGAHLKQAFAGANMIIGNDYEIDIMEKKTNIKDIHRHFRDKIIVTTLGEKGSRVSYKGQHEEVKSSQVRDTSDPAGAGDAYRAGFVAGFMHGLSIRECAQMGSVCAAYTVEKYGTTTHDFTVLEFTRRYRDNYHQDLKFLR